MTPKIVDITEALFLPANLTLEERRRWELWDLAGEEAGKFVYDLPLFQGPLMLYDYTKRVYIWYLEKEGLKYDEESGL